MPKRNIGLEILEGIREIKAFKTGSGTLRVRTLNKPAPTQRPPTPSK